VKRVGPRYDGPGVWVAGALRAVVTALILATVLAAVNLAQLLTVVLLPLPWRLFGRANRFIVHQALSRVGGMAEWLHDVDVVCSGDVLPPGENAVVLVNHQSATDVNFVFSLAWRQRRLGDLKWFAKAPLRFVPGIGWSLHFLDTLFVARRWAEDRRRVERVFARMRRQRLPFWLLLFCEGTRRTEARDARSRERAQAEGRPALKHLLLPRTHGFVASVQGLREETGAVYDLTIGYPDGVPGLGALLAGRVGRVHLYTRRFPAADLPREERALAEWLHELWRSKDALLAGFAAAGRFP
jgi:1-acyl-sn-glycerol-3-phosphate acyltransferase